MKYSNEQCLVAYKQGVELSTAHDGRHISLKELLDSDISLSFQDHECRKLIVNDACMKVYNAAAFKDIENKTIESIFDKSSARIIMAHDKTLLKKKAMSVIYEKFNTQIDNFCYQTITFKMPWYSENKLIGTFKMLFRINDQDHMQAGYKILQSLGNQGILPHSEMTRFNNILSKRELQCLEMYRCGYTAKMIANRLQLTQRTVEFYLSNLKNKLQVTSKEELLSLMQE